MHALDPLWVKIFLGDSYYGWGVVVFAGSGGAGDCEGRQAA